MFYCKSDCVCCYYIMHYILFADMRDSYSTGYPPQIIEHITKV